MSSILNRAECKGQLKAYYLGKYGQRDTDRWYDTSAVNVGAFARDGKLIVLKCHLLTGEVTERVTSMN